jgi:hypothetical protein
MAKRPTADETREAARILRDVLERTAEGNTADAGTRGVVRRVEGAIVGLEASAGQ